MQTRYYTITDYPKGTPERDLFQLREEELSELGEGEVDDRDGLRSGIIDWIQHQPVFERLAPTPFSVVCFRALPEGIEGEELDQEALDRLACDRRVKGVVLIIAPWNFPLVLAIRKIAPALAAGCTVILKPASATPLSACELARCIHAVGLPKGVFQLVAGSAAEIGAELPESVSLL